jgi:hypothetical protein
VKRPARARSTRRSSTVRKSRKRRDGWMVVARTTIAALPLRGVNHHFTPAPQRKRRNESAALSMPVEKLCTVAVRRTRRRRANVPHRTSVDDPQGVRTLATRIEHSRKRGPHVGTFLAYAASSS